VKSRSEPLASQSLETKSAGSMQLPKTPKGRKRYRELVDATKTALNKKGYSALNIQDIAAEADAPIAFFTAISKVRTMLFWPLSAPQYQNTARSLRALKEKPISNIRKGSISFLSASSGIGQA
jgi:hypothetical protein